MTAARPHTPTSEVLDGLLQGAPAEKVTLGWLIDSLQERSFGIVMLLLGLISLVPGAATFAALFLTIPAFQMMMARRAPAFPGFVSRRALPTRRLSGLIGRLNPVLRRLEKVIRPRWTTPFETTKRIVGGIVLLLAVSLLSPIPFSHVPPALVIVLLSFAYLEEDGIALCVALAAALATLAFTGVAVWATIKGIDFLDPATVAPGGGI